MAEENIFNEVDEELRNERMRNLWRKYAPIIFGLILLIVLSVAGKEAYTWWKNDVSAKSSDQFYVAIELANDGNIDEAQKALDIVVSEGSGDYAILAQFRSASLLLEADKVKEAVAAYDALATSLSNPSLRDLALILAGFALVDGGDVKEVEARVGGFLAPDNVLRNRAKEAIALTHYGAGDINEALGVFEQIMADPLASSQNNARVQIYVEQLIAQGAKSPAIKEEAQNEASPQ